MFFRFNINIVHTVSPKKVNPQQPNPKAKSKIMQMGVATFCKAFPWHFVIDRRLELVQLGVGFMRLFGCMLTTYGTSVATYFEFHRPRSITLSFSEIIKRVNTPFVLTIRKLPGVDLFPAEVSRLTSTLFLPTFIFTLRGLFFFCEKEAVFLTLIK